MKSPDDNKINYFVAYEKFYQIKKIREEIETNLWKINTNMVKISKNQNKGYALLAGFVARVRYDETKVSLSHQKFSHFSK